MAKGGVDTNTQSPLFPLEAVPPTEDVFFDPGDQEKKPRAPRTNKLSPDTVKTLETISENQSPRKGVSGSGVKQVTFRTTIYLTDSGNDRTEARTQSVRDKE